MDNTAHRPARKKAVLAHNEQPTSAVAQKLGIAELDKKFRILYIVRSLCVIGIQACNLQMPNLRHWEVPNNSLGEMIPSIAMLHPTVR